MRYAASSFQFGPWRAALDARARHTGRPVAILARIGISVACVTPYHSRLESFEVASVACVNRRSLNPAAVRRGEPRQTEPSRGTPQ